MQLYVYVYMPKYPMHDETRRDGSETKAMIKRVIESDQAYLSMIAAP